MQIDPTLLSEKNYTGTRLILVDDPKLEELQKKLTSYQLEINPLLDKLQRELWSEADKEYAEVQKYQEKIQKLKARLQDRQAKYSAEIEKVQSAEQKAQAVKDRMQPIILKAVEGQLGEFETAKNTVVRDGKVYAEVYDEIEEKVKAIRLQKANAKK